MKKKYWFYKNGSEIGPFTLDEIKKKKIKNDTLIWEIGTEKWKNAKEFDWFKNLEKEKRRKIKFKIILGISIMIFFLIIALYDFFSNK